MLSGEIQASIGCVRCGYDLRGLMPDGVCPECGGSIALTLPPCPRCLRTDAEPFALTPLARDGIGTWSCARCGGLGFDRDRLRTVAGSLERPTWRASTAVFDLVSQSSVACTRCRAPMESIVIDTRTLIDRCRDCGLIWLDAGEIGPLAAYLRRHLGQGPTPRDLEENLGNAMALREAVEGTLLSRAREKSALEDIVWTILWLLGS